MTVPVRVCFVCLGNICRSPTAEAVMRHLVSRAGLDGAIAIEGAGTGDWHVGQPRDGRAQQFTATVLARFDYVIAMDGSNLADLRAMAPDAAAREKITLLRSYEPG